MKLLFIIAGCICFFSCANQKHNVQEQITLHHQKNVTEAIENNLGWFQRVSEKFHQFMYSVSYTSNNQSYSFHVVKDPKEQLGPEELLKDNYQFGQGSSTLDDGRRLDVKYMYDNEIFRVELSRFLPNGMADKSFFHKGTLSKTYYKRDSEGGMIIFNTDEHLVIAGYTQSDSTFVYIR